ncbi:MAG: hypothetical protein AB1490_08065 [Pseudomonadota bacterium]
MSVKLVNEEIARFLSRTDAEVLCIRGKWGVGKTYTWTKQLEAAQRENSIKLPRYSYVSLFGINSLDELKFSIFENVITLNNGVKKANLETLDEFVNSRVGSWRKLTRYAQSMPFVKSIVGGDTTALVSFMTIQDQIICVDDLERRGQKLDVNDVLGLLSYLREQRNCKVVLILNDEKLEGEAKRIFEKNLEKVIDVSLVFEPTAADSAKIGVPGEDDTSKLVAERCIALGITNVRVIKRITRFVSAIQPLLKDFDSDVLKSTVGSIALFCWSHDQPEEAPSLEFLLDKTNDKFGIDRNREAPPREFAWNALLESYGYTWTDDFDLVLIEGIRKGYFDPEKIERHAKEQHDKIIATKAGGSFEQAWRPYHDSFENNQDAVLDGLFDSFMKNFRYVSPTNLDGTVRLFKDLDRPEQAQRMLQHYMANRNEDREFFDLDESPFGDSVSDPDVRAAFKEKATHAEERRDLPAIMMSIKDGWDDERINALATAPIEEYRKAFKFRSGSDLRRMLSAVFQFDRIANASDAMREISRRAREALKLIGAESPINARRVRRFGVTLQPETGQPAANQAEPGNNNSAQ